MITLLLSVKPNRAWIVGSGASDHIIGDSSVFSWAGTITNRKSTSSYCTYVWGILVTWRSKKRRVVATRVEVEVTAMTRGIYEGLWTHRVLKEH